MYKLVHSGKQHELWYLPGCSSRYSWRHIVRGQWNGVRPLHHERYTPYFKCLYDIRSFLVENTMIYPKYIYEEVNGIYQPSHLIKSKKGPYISINGEVNV